jgi:5'-methylthioadenosine phosphorylase
MLPDQRTCVCSTALEHALITEMALIPEKTKKHLEPIIGKYIKKA